jgi:hypothetical protein
LLKINHARIDAKELPPLLRRIEVYQGKQVTRLARKSMSMTFVRTTELIEPSGGSLIWRMPAGTYPPCA